MMSGKRYEEMKKNLVDWYVRTRGELIRRMEQEYPPGSIRLSPAQQVERFLNMTPEEWQMELYRIGLRHSGKPNQDELVQTDVMDYLSYIRNYLQRSMTEGPRGG